MQSRTVLLIISFLAISVIINGCTGQSGKGVLAGKVTIGPICPVEKYPPDPNCQPTAETYEAWPVWVWNADKSAKVVQIQPEIDGSYKSELPVGIYIIDLGIQNNGIGGSNLPVQIVINSNQTTSLDINIDTGIR
jgi:hypothetical protein